MGCDIHSFIEYKHKDSNYWSNFGGRINPGRIYEMFAKLGDVRNSYGYEPIAANRGVPEDISYAAFESYSRYVSEDANDNNGYVALEIAEKWVSEGSSVYLRDKKRFISGPDWHSGSWCTSDELKKAIDEVWPEGLNGCVTEWVVLFDAMKSFERQRKSTRLVFWFDN